MIDHRTCTELDKTAYLHLETNPIHYGDGRSQENLAQGEEESNNASFLLTSWLQTLHLAIALAQQS